MTVHMYWLHKYLPRPEFYFVSLLAPALQIVLGYTPEELAQPPHILTRPTTSSHHCTIICGLQQPPTPPSTQQEAAQLGITLEELAAISKEAT